VPWAEQLAIVVMLRHILHSLVIVVVMLRPLLYYLVIIVVIALVFIINIKHGLRNKWFRPQRQW
jgi:hypothetical protein